MIKVPFERPDIANAFHNPELLPAGWRAIIPDDTASIEPSCLEFVAVSRSAPIGFLKCARR